MGLWFLEVTRADKIEGGSHNDVQAALGGVDNFYTIKGAFAAVWRKGLLRHGLTRTTVRGDSKTVQAVIGQGNKRVHERLLQS